ncbi:exonuclease family domain protein, partial [Escherichia coli EC1737]
TGKSYR